MGKAKREPETVKHEVATSIAGGSFAIARQDRMLRCIDYLDEHGIELEKMLGCGALVVRETLARLRSAAKTAY